MEKADLARFSAMMALVAEQYGRSMSPELIRFYFDGLSDLPLETVSAALTAHVRDPNIGQFMPKIADIVKLCAGNEEEAAYVALGELARGNGSDDPITARIIEEMGGWRAYGMRETAEWQSFGSKDFIKRYCIYKKRERMENSFPALSMSKRVEQLKLGREPGSDDE